MCLSTIVVSDPQHPMGAYRSGIGYKYLILEGGSYYPPYYGGKRVGWYPVRAGRDRIHDYPKSYRAGFHIYTSQDAPQIDRWYGHPVPFYRVHWQGLLAYGTERDTAQKDFTVLVVQNYKVIEEVIRE